MWRWERHCQSWFGGRSRGILYIHSLIDYKQRVSTIQQYRTHRSTGQANPELRSWLSCFHIWLDLLLEQYGDVGINVQIHICWMWFIFNHRWEYEKKNTLLSLWFASLNSIENIKQTHTHTHSPVVGLRHKCVINKNLNLSSDRKKKCILGMGLFSEAWNLVWLKINMPYEFVVIFRSKGANDKASQCVVFTIHCPPFDSNCNHNCHYICMIIILI